MKNHLAVLVLLGVALGASATAHLRPKMIPVCEPGVRDHSDGGCPRHAHNNGCFGRTGPKHDPWRKRCPESCGVCAWGYAHEMAKHADEHADDDNDEISRLEAELAAKEKCDFTQETQEAAVEAAAKEAKDSVTELVFKVEYGWDGSKFLGEAPMRPVSRWPSSHPRAKGTRAHGRGTIHTPFYTPSTPYDTAPTSNPSHPSHPHAAIYTIRHRSHPSSRPSHSHTACVPPIPPIPFAPPSLSCLPPSYLPPSSRSFQRRGVPGLQCRRHDSRR